MDDLYDADVLEWSEHQARLLQRHAAGGKDNETPDWANIIEEITSVGRSQLRAVENLLVLALLHDLKGEAWPLSLDVPHWRAEARGFRKDARRHFTPSMRGKLNLDELYADALDRMPETLDGQPPLPVPSACPVTLDELVGAEA